MASDEHISLRVGRETTVTVMFEGPVTQNAIERLIAYLENTKEDYPSLEEKSLEERMGGPIQWSKPNAS